MRCYAKPGQVRLGRRLAPRRRRHAAYAVWCRLFVTVDGRVSEVLAVGAGHDWAPRAECRCPLGLTYVSVRARSFYRCLTDEERQNVGGACNPFVQRRLLQNMHSTLACWRALGALSQRCYVACNPLDHTTLSAGPDSERSECLWAAVVALLERRACTLRQPMYNAVHVALGTRGHRAAARKQVEPEP